MSNANDDLQVDEGVNVKLDQPTLYIGNKPLMAYVTSALIQLTNNNRLFIKARGNSIGRAVDISQIIVRKMERAGYHITDIIVGSEELTSNDDKKRQVSFISLEITKDLK
jgi:DNA-binding protein